MMRKSIVFCLAVFAAFLLFSCSDPPVVEPVVWSFQAKVDAATAAETGSLFGQAVALSDTYAVVGAYLDDVGGLTDAGAVYIYKRNGATWPLYQTIPGPAAICWFGYSVDVFGNRIVIGAPGAAPAACVYTDNGTAFVKTFEFTEGVSGDFGSAVAINGDWVVVGDKLRDWGGSTSAPEGAVYIYNGAAGWTSQVLRPETQAEDDLFGYAVDICGAVLIVGAPRNGITANKAGAVYLFRYDGATWGTSGAGYENAILTNGSGAAGDYFGSTLAIATAYLSVGSTGNGGSVLVFKQASGNWYAHDFLSLDAFTVDDKLGYALGLTDEFAVCGTSAADAVAVDAGSCHIFRPAAGSWPFVASKTAADAAISDQFGSAVAAYGSYLICGAPGCAIGGTANAGAAYIFYREP